MDEKEKQDEEKGNTRVALNSIAGMAANAVYLISRLAITPFILFHVPLDQYGLWSVCFIILSYAGLSGFGVNNAYIRYVAEYNAKGETDKLNSLLSTGLVTMSGICASIFVAMYVFIPFFLKKFEISPELEELSRTLIIGSAAVFLLDLGLGGFKALLEGLQEIVLVRMIWLASTLVEVSLIVAFLLLGHGVMSLLYALSVRYLLGIVCYMMLSFKTFPPLSLGFKRVSREALKVLFTFGGKVQLLGFIGIFMTTFDRMVTVAIIGLEATGRFEIGRKFPTLGASVSAAAFDSFLPAASSSGAWLKKKAEPTFNEKAGNYGKLILFSLILAGVVVLPWLISEWNNNQGNSPIWLVPAIGFIVFSIFWPGFRLLFWFRSFMAEAEHVVGEDIKELYFRGSRYLNLLNAVLLIFLFAVAKHLIFSWVGEGYNSSVQVMMIIAVSVLINLATGPGTSLVKGMNRAGREFEYALVNLILAIVWVPFLAFAYGMIGAALGTALSTSVASIFFISRTNRAFLISGKHYLQQAVLPLAAPVVAGGIIFLILSFLPLQSRWLVLFAIVAAGLFYLSITWFILKTWIFSRKEMDTITSPIKGLAVKVGLLQASN